MEQAELERGDLAEAAAPLIRTAGLTKHYPGVLALDQVSFDLNAGEVHILFGENGAGKSTLISILAGANRPSAGEIYLRGEPIHFESVLQARRLGISAVFQEFSLVPQMTVAENIFLGAETTRFGLLERTRLRRRAEEIIARLGFPLRPNARVQDLSRAEQQMVEITKAFRSELSVLILDEPTASLTERETEQLFRLIEQIKQQGVGIIYITHRMQEIKRIGDRITVLRDGRYIATLDAKQAEEDQLVRLMTGRVISEVFPTIRSTPGEEALRLEGVTTRAITDASLHVRAGEIVGLAGLVGSGKSEAVRAAFGIESMKAGRVFLKGRDVTGWRPRQLMEAGLFYVPPDRREEGLMTIRSCLENMMLPAIFRPPFTRAGFLDRAAERSAADKLARRLNLQPMKIDRAVDHFSGGNQQKVLLAKSLSRPIDVFIFDEPTVGVDVGTRVAIYGFIRDLCEAGAAIVLVSSDLPEIVHLAHRAYVFHRGRIQAELAKSEITEEALVSLFFERKAA
jgi:ribose transport system ATP-binding protein